MTTDVNPHAYNTAWQFRADAWCRLEEASRRLSTAAARGNDLTELIALVEGLLYQLRPFERYWAFPGIQVFGQTHRLFTTGAFVQRRGTFLAMTWLAPVMGALVALGEVRVHERELRLQRRWR